MKKKEISLFIALILLVVAALSVVAYDIDVSEGEAYPPAPTAQPYPVVTVQPTQAPSPTNTPQPQPTQPPAAEPTPRPPDGLPGAPMQ